MDSKKIKVGENILPILLKSLKKRGVRPSDGDILVIASKALALEQNRMVDLKSVIPSPWAKRQKKLQYNISKADPRLVELILREADIVIPGNVYLTLKDNILIPSAGIDLSNAPEGFALLWPKNTESWARGCMNAVKKMFRLKHFGVVIIDSRCQPLRWGTVGVALAFAGFEGVEDARGQKDMYGKKLKVTRKAVADNLASAAEIVMGEAGEQTPFVLIRKAPVHFTNKKMSSFPTAITPRECLYSGIYSKKFKNMLH